MNPACELQASPLALHDRSGSPTPEGSLLLGCLRSYVGTGPVPAIPESGIDWARFGTLAAAHGVEPLALEMLSFAGGSAPPDDVLHKLRLRAHAIAYRNLQLTRELLRVVEALGRQGIDVLPLKGAVAAQALYGNLGHRPFRDLDLLVRQRDLFRAEKLLLDHGYQSDETWGVMRRRLYPYAGGHHFQFRNQGDASLELHWRVAPIKLAFPLEDDGFWSRRRELEIAGSTLPMNAPEDLLLVLSIHGARHWWNRLCWLCDIAALLRTYPDLDWDAVRGRARAIGGTRALRLALRAVRDVLGTELPAPIAGEVEADCSVNRLMADVRRTLFLHLDLEKERSARWRFYLGLRERLRDRLRFTCFQPLGTLFWHSAPDAPTGDASRPAAPRAVSPSPAARLR